MINDILDILKKDSRLSLVLKPTLIDSKIYMNTGKSDTCISYKYTPITNDGIKAQDKIEINCISKDYSIANKLMDIVKSLLITIGDEKLNDSILEISLNGGGYLFNEDTNQHILKAFFIVKSRYRKE